MMPLGWQLEQCITLQESLNTLTKSIVWQFASGSKICSANGL